ncbi:MAG: tape measure protein [Anaerovoracaceae bacterium]
MAADGHLNFDTKIDEKGFSSGVSRLGSVAKTGLGVLGTAVGAVTTAMGAGITAGIKYNANIEQYTTSFEVMTGSAEKAAQIMEELQKIGAETPFETETIAETTQLLMNYGFTADEAIEKMRMLGDISQGSADKMNRIAMAYGQMSSAGKVQLEDVKQMIEAGFNPLQEISESTGESMESLYDRISNGTLAVDEITASMQRATSEGGKYYQSMEKQAQTINGLISTLKDNAMQLLGEVVEPISDSMREELLPAAIDAIEGMQKAFKEDGVDGLIEAGTEVISNFLLGMAEGAPQVIETALQIINSLVNALIENAPQIATSAVSVVMAFAQGVIQMLPSLLSLGMQLIISLIQGLAQQIPQLIPVALKTVLQLVQGITSNLPKIVKAGIDLLVKLIEGIVSALPQLIAYAPQIILALLKGIIGAVGQLLTAGPKILVAVGKGIINALGTIWNYAKQIPGKIKDAILDTNWGSIGRSIISGIANGLAGAAGRIVDAAKSAAKKALNAAKDFLGINSPSRLFRDEVGKYMAQGIGVGFERYMPTDDMVKDLDRSVSKINASVHPAFPKPAYRNGGNVDQSKQVTVNQTVNINQPVETPAETARAIKKTATYGLAGT